MTMLGVDPRAARITWTVAVVVGALALVYLARATLFVFALALFLSYMLAPLVRRIDRYRARPSRPTVSVVAAFAIVLAVIAVAVIVVGPSVADQAVQLANQLPAMLEHLRSGGQMPLPGWLESWRPQITRVLTQALEGAAGSALPVTRRVIVGIGGAASDALYVILIPILAYIILVEGANLRRGLLYWLAPFGRQETIIALLAEVHDALGRYVRALGLLSLATLFVYSVLFTLLGVPYSVVLAVLAAVLEFIPVIGPLIAAATTLVVAGVAGYPHLLWLLAIFLAYRLFQDYMLSPRLMSGGAGVHPMLVIFGFLAGDEIAGIPGMFLSVPLIATLVIVLRYEAQRRVVRPAGTPAAPREPDAQRSTNARSIT
jgi:predicted PurR-regulated permease PerM